MYAIIDIETTGGSPKTEKITEIAIFVHDGTKITKEYATLINPERNIPYFITSLTGITNEMVADAPKFYEVAKEIVEITEGMVFVAHNSSFDYGFIKQEFKSLGYEFSRKQLCTVRLSRKLIPGMPSYSLGKICKALDIKINDRHRAAGDAIATVLLFEKLLILDKEVGLTKSIKKLILSGVHEDFHEQKLYKLPKSAGVYYFFNQDEELIYIGKSTNIQKRVIQHFGNEKSTRSIKMKSSIVDIHYEETGSELIALLLESDEIKKHKPVFNRAQRRSSFTNGFFTYTDQNGYLRLQIGKTNRSDSPLTAFSSHEEAKNQMHQLIAEYQLCQKLCGVYQTDGACFHHGIEECNGACIGKEEPALYNERVKEAISRFEFINNNFIVIDIGRSEKEKSLVLVENGRYIGFGYCENEFISGDLDLLKDCIKLYTDNRDTHQIIRGHLKRKKVEKILIL
jgi:DNA polymerase III subunit epsilon